MKFPLTESAAADGPVGGSDASPAPSAGAPADEGKSTKAATASPSGLDSYDAELERTKSQLLVFAREMSRVYQQEREKARRLGEINEELRGDYLSIIQTPVTPRTPSANLGTTIIATEPGASGGRCR